ncbi:hypothetical protein T10_6622, partial [Trichinella papuae]
MLSCTTQRLRNQIGYLTDLRRFWPPDAESGQEKLHYKKIFKLERKIPQQLELVAVYWLVDRAFYLAQLLVLLFIRCQQINASMDKRLTQAAKIVALILKLGPIRQPWKTVRYMVKHRRKSSLCMLSVSNRRFVEHFLFPGRHSLELELPLTSIPTVYSLSIRGCSARIGGADSLNIIQTIEGKLFNDYAIFYGLCISLKCE